MQQNSRRARRAWSWPRNQFWFENLVNGSFDEDWWKENFRITRRTFEFIVCVAGQEMAKKDTRLRQSIPVHKRVAVALWRLAAYPLSVWLMKPFKQTRTLSERQLRFNRALSQARVVIEQAYGILKGRWRCLYKAMEEKTSRVAITILACCVLHNICIDVGDPSPIDILGDDDDDMDQSLNGDVSPIASDVRDKIMDYLSA